MLKKVNFSLQLLAFCLMAFLMKPLVAGEGYVNNNGVRIFYRDIGKKQKQTIVFLHGYPLSGKSFDCQIEDLKLYFRIITIDGRGFGRSDKPTAPADYTFPNFVSDVDAVVSHLGIKQFALAGVSYGSVTAEAYTLTFPQKVSHLILIAPFYGQFVNNPPFTDGLPVGIFDPLIAGLAVDPAATDAAFISLAVPETCKTGAHVRKVDNHIASQSPAYAQINLLTLAKGTFPYPALLNTITAPTLILYASQDVIAPRVAVGALMQHALNGGIENSTMVEINGGHFAIQTQAERFNRAIFSFLIANPASCHGCH